MGKFPFCQRAWGNEEKTSSLWEYSHRYPRKQGRIECARCAIFKQVFLTEHTYTATSARGSACPSFWDKDPLDESYGTSAEGGCRDREHKPSRINHRLVSSYPRTSKSCHRSEGYNGAVLKTHPTRYVAEALSGLNAIKRKRTQVALAAGAAAPSQGVAA